MDKLRLMETYAQVVSCGSFARAADKLGVSRGVVTKHVAKLEKALGVRLLNRTTRRLSPTEIGLDYFDFCRGTLRGINEAEGVLSRRQEEASGSLKLSAPKAFASLYLGALVAEFSKQNPKIEVTALIGGSPTDRVNLVENGFDLVIRLSRPVDSSIIARHICDLSWVVAASPSYLASMTSPPLTPSGLARANCLTHTRLTADGVWRFFKGGEETAVRVSGTLKSDSVAVLRNAALEDLGIALLPAYCIAQDLAAKRLIHILPAYELTREELFVLFPYSDHVPKKVRLFVDFLSHKLRRPPWELEVDAPTITQFRQQPRVKTRSGQR